MTAKKITDFADGGTFQSGDSVLIARGVDNFHVNGGVIANAIATLTSLTNRLSTLESAAGSANAPIRFKHYRVRSTTPGDGSTFGMAELEFFSNGTKLTGTPFALHEDASYPASQAFDGNLSNYYLSTDNAVGSYLGLSLASTATIDRVKLYSADSHRYIYMPKAFIVEGSNDVDPKADAYTVIATLTGQTWTSSEVKSFDPAPVYPAAAPSVVVSTGGGETILASCILYINDADGTIDTAKTKKNNIGTITRTAAGKWRFAFTKPLPNLDVHISASCQYGTYDDDWHTYPVFPRKAADRLSTTGVAIWTPQQNGAFYDPVKLEFKITAFTPEVVTPVTSSVSADRWRLLFPEGSAGTGNSYMRIAGVEFRKAIGVAEAHSDGVVLGTSGANEPLGNAFDGNPSTYWDAGYETATNSNIGFGFNAFRTVKEVAITASSVASYAPKSFKVQYLDSGLNWVDVFTSTSPLSWTANETKVFTL